MHPKKTTEKAPVPETKKGQTEANQVWSKLNTNQQRKIAQSLVQVCVVLANERAKLQEVGHDSDN